MTPPSSASLRCPGSPAWSTRARSASAGWPSWRACPGRGPPGSPTTWGGAGARGPQGRPAGPPRAGRRPELKGLPGAAATRLADKLEAAGLVVRQATPGDRRGVQVVATPAGIEVLARYARAGNEWLAPRPAAPRG